MNPKDTHEALYPQHKSGGSQSDPVASLLGPRTATRTSTNSPIPFIDFADVSTGYVREVLTLPPQRGMQRGGVTDPFPCRLHQMLSYSEHQGLENIVSWQPHGRSFHIYDWEALHKVLMPRFFGKSKASTFRRQLYLYGFAVLKTGPDSGSFYHMLFLRHRSDLCPLIFRKRYAIASPSREPNFYTLPSCPKTGCDSGHAFNKVAASQQSHGRIAPVSASRVVHSGALATIHPPQAVVQMRSTQNQMLPCSHPIEHGSLSVSGDRDYGGSVDPDGHGTFAPIHFPSHDLSSIHGPKSTAAQAVLTDQMPPLDDSICVSSIYSAAIEARKERLVDNRGGFDSTRKVQADMDISDNCASKAAGKANNHRHPHIQMNSLSSHTERLDDVCRSVLDDTWFHSKTDNFSIAHKDTTRAVETPLLQMIPMNPDMYGTNRMFFGSQAPRHDDNDSHTHPSIEAEILFSMLEPEPLTESDLAACRRIGAQRRS